MPGFQQVFTVKRFYQLNRYIFFCNPDELDLENPTRADKLVKTRPFVQQLQKVFKENFNCGKNLAIDEAMIPYKGKLSFKQRILGKPVHCVIDVFELCDSETAYLIPVTLRSLSWESGGPRERRWANICHWKRGFCCGLADKWFLPSRTPAIYR